MVVASSSNFFAYHCTKIHIHIHMLLTYIILQRGEAGTMAYRRNHSFHVGDRVMTANCRLGTVTRVSHDEMGDYFVVRLDLLKGEFAYDPWDLEKV